MHGYHGGRTDTAFAVELGSMKLNEKLPFTNLGISKVVLPEQLAFMIPLLTLYADEGGFCIDQTQVMDFPCFISWKPNRSKRNVVLTRIRQSPVFGLVIGSVGYTRIGKRQRLRCPWPVRDLGRRHEHYAYRSCDALFEMTFSYLDLGR